MTNNIIFTRPSEIIGEMSGLVTVPRGYEKGKEKLPVIVFLHGSGERGPNDRSMAQRLMAQGIPKYFGADCEYKGVRAITLSPECPKNIIWSHLVFPLKKWIEEAVEFFGGDESRIAITGISMGGFGTWDMIQTFPHYFYKSAPICGGGTSWRCRNLANAKIRVFHGLDDDAVPFGNSLEMVSRAVKAGADVTLTAYDKVGHASWVKAYEETDLIEWLVE